MSFSRLDNLLQASSGNSLSKIISRAQAMEALTSKLRSKLSPDFAQHLVAANLRPDGELVIICESSTWASRIRYEADTLMTVARTEGRPVLKCTIKVRT